jgi:hypothetical protein
MIDFSEDFNESESDDLIKKCMEHLDFTRNSSIHLYQNLLIEKLIQHLASWMRRYNGTT